MKELLSKEQQRESLFKKKGKSVKFKYPERRNNNKEMRYDNKIKKYVLEGKLLERYVADVEDNNSLTYWFVFDLIKFKGEEEYWVRITYYRYLKEKKPRWVFAGQTSLSAPYSEFRKFFIDAIKDKENEWIKKLFVEICSKSYSSFSIP